ncbi:serine-type D-Ala-D-Ala carboxypeptidase [Streptococcus viridans]|nr:serine-type D-Ala-D-Ala carboxypeptidase [Streptococcus viridans]
MKKRIGILLVASLFLLTACGEKKTNVETKQEGKATSAKVASSEQVKKKAKVHYNGSYYSVKGKYDEIVIANKHYPLSSDYNPGENPTAKAKLLELIATMQREGYPISHQYSGFRSYQTQVTLYQNYVNQDGKEAADRYSARPGYSEH